MKTKLFYLCVLISMLITLLTSCGAVTKATIRNGADSTSTSVTITTNNPTDWKVSPSVEIPSSVSGIPPTSQVPPDSTRFYIVAHNYPDGRSRVPYIELKRRW